MCDVSYRAVSIQSSSLEDIKVGPGDMTYMTSREEGIGTQELRGRGDPKDCPVLSPWVLDFMLHFFHLNSTLKRLQIYQLQIDRAPKRCDS